MFARYRLHSSLPRQVDDITSWATVNPDLIYVFDDILPNTLFQQLCNYNYSDLTWQDRRGETAWHVFNAGELPRPAFLTTTKQYIVRHLQTIDPDAAITSVAFEFVMKSQPGDLGQSVHPDVYEYGPHWSILIHIAGDGGQTTFYNDLEGPEVFAVDFKPGRVIIFPSIYLHKGNLPVTGTRYVLNSIVQLKFAPTADILKLSPELQAKKQAMMVSPFTLG